MKLNNYFISLEKRFTELSDFIEINEENFDVFSNNIGLLLISACSEFEVVCKEMAKNLQVDWKEIKDFKISDFHKTLCLCERNSCDNIFQETVELFGFKLSVQPFENWTERDYPFWWKAYNSFKHDRLNSYKRSNLKAVIYALSALSIVNHYYLWLTEWKGKSRSAAVMSMDYIPKHFRIKLVNYFGPVDADDIFEI
ncbi:hypothetical protein [Sphingobacterium sp. UBA2074]|uniref:hypothetical protein n=1 Tax=Sphingobacterium sp. UBA2074 TaxID=1947487 RepID=UPI002580EF21|nr:hypothetical protein [Sphingobacterium sp. UBA2074]